MISEELQYRIHRGEREAFMTLYSDEAKNVYLRALSATGDENCAKEAVKRVFSSVYREVRAAAGPVDLDARIKNLTDAAIADLTVQGLPGPEPASQPPVPKEKPVTEEPLPARKPELPPEQPKEEAPKKHGRRRGSRKGDVLLTLLIILLALAVLWMIVGILMDLGVLPTVDLGYRWFNETIYPLFTMEGGAR